MSRRVCGTVISYSLEIGMNNDGYDVPISNARKARGGG
jgi:hypothetical protein